MAFFSNKFDGIDYFESINFHHLEFYVGNAKQAREYYKKVFGFSDYAYAGPETGVRDRVSYVLRKNKVFYVLTTPLSSNHPISDWLKKHGDGVYDIAFDVASVADAYEGCINRGAQSADDLITIEDENGYFSKASIKSYGDCIHSFINNKKYSVWAPDFKIVNNPINSVDTKIELIDHVVANVELENILLISKEILRRSFLGCYGSSKPFKTPNIDKLASEGTVFRNHYTAAVSTAMAITGLFSGLNMYELDRKVYREVKPFTESTIFSQFHKKGYQTHVVWPKWMNEMAWKYSKVFDKNTQWHELEDVSSHIRGQNFHNDPKNPKSYKKFYDELEGILADSEKPKFIWMHFPHVLNPSESIGGDITIFDNLIGEI